MSAVIVRLPGAQQVTPGIPPALSETLSWGRQSMAAIVERMLQNADDTMFSMAESSNSDESRRRLFDTMRILRRTAPAIIREFNAGLHPEQQQQAKSGEVELSLLDDAKVELDIVISRMVSRIDGVAKDALWEFAIRLENISGMDGLRSCFERLRPAEVARAFSASIEIEGIDAEAKLILFKLYERQLLSDSHPFYDGLNLRLEAAGISSKALQRRSGNSAGGRPVSSLSLGDEPPTAAAYHLPAQLRSLLDPAQGSGLQSPYPTAHPHPYPRSPGNGYAGHEGMPGSAPGWGAPSQALSRINLQSVGSVQRISLVNQLLDELSAGREETETDALKRLIVPLIRIALSDRRFFGDQHHPARELLTALSQPAEDLSSRIVAAETALQSMQQELEVPSDVAPLEATDLHQFLLDQRTTRHTTSARLDEARQAAHAQVKSVGSGRDLPAGMASFLTQVWLPLVSALHLRYGQSSAEVNRTHQLLEKLFGECRWVPGLEDRKMVDEILEDLDRELRQIAVPPSLINKAKGLLSEGLIAKDGSRNLLDLENFSSRPPRPTPTPGTPVAKAATKNRLPYPGDTASWRSALPPGSWFRVFDRAQDKTLWVASGIIYPQATSLAFSGFDPDAKISIDRLQFLADLVGGKAEAVDPTEPQTSAIRLLCLEYQRFPKGSGEAATA